MPGVIKLKSLTAALVASAMALTACSHSEGFEIELQLDGQESHGIEMVVTNSRGVTFSELHPRKGSVTATAVSEEPAFVEFYQLGGGAPLASLVASNGDRIKISYNIEQGRKSLKLSGHEASERFARWTVANDSLLAHAPDGEVNDSILAYVNAHRNDIASTLMMATHYRAALNPMRADSVFNLLAPDARPRGLVASFSASLANQVSAQTREPLRSFIAPVGRDTVAMLSPSGNSYSLLVFNNTSKPDSVKRLLRALHKGKPRRFGILELSFSTDSAMWRANISRDSAKWQQAWLAGGPASAQVRRLNIPTVPFYVVIDSLGYQAYRGRSLAAADSLLRSRLKFSNSKEAADNADDNNKDTTVDTPSEKNTGAVNPAASQAPAAPARPGIQALKKVGE